MKSIKAFLVMGSLASLLFLSMGEREQSIEKGPLFDYRQQNDEFWKEKLPKDVYQICRMKGTEPADSGTYDHLDQEGLYYCACCGGDYPLFSSETKYDSKTGWPSFYAPLTGRVIEREDLGNFFSAALPWA